ncbi:hypothetical protein [Streptomyces sp. NPDC052721]|uniref:hypothetical protein n=1 Tax=Streptomyces sp. NPDC052721 TaxID=3154955 RepID=UPI00343C3803
MVRAAALDVLRALRLGEARVFAAALDDPGIAVRTEAVRALVSVDAVRPPAGAADDPSREVRVTVAKALATVSRRPSPRPTGICSPPLWTG